jgi:hypothetical protein
VTRAKDMLDTHPGDSGFDADQLAAAIDALAVCQQTCVACADACLGEDVPAEMRSCITSDLNCADLCLTTLRVLSRQTAYDARITRAVLTACVEVCAVCAEECEQHGEHGSARAASAVAEGMAHCRVCAEACRACEEACRALLDSMG